MQDATFEYDRDLLVRLRIDTHGQYNDSFETTWTRDADGNVSLIRRLDMLDGFTGEWVLTFDADYVTQTYQGEVERRWDRARYAELPAPGSSAYLPLADLGLIEKNGMPCTWTTEGAILVRTCSDDRATFALDDRGRIVTKTVDTGNDGTVDGAVHYVFEADLLVRTFNPDTTKPWSQDWRYDLGGNIASMEVEQVGYSAHEEYDYGCW